MAALKRKLLTVLCCLVVGGCTTARDHIEPYKNISCLGRAAISLADAIAAAEAAANQRVVDAEYNIESEMACAEGDPGHYDVTLYVDGTLRRATVDARSSEVGPGHYEPFVRHVLELDVLSDWPEAEMLRGGPALRQARTTMRQAVQVAETRNGKALAAHVKTEKQKTTYVIELVNAGRIRLVRVDAESAAVRDG